LRPWQPSDRLYTKAGNKAAARLALEMTIDIAESVAYSSVADLAGRELDALVD